MSDHDLDILAEHYGIVSSYTNVWKTRTVTIADTKRALLSAMGVSADTDAEIKENIEAVLAGSRHRMIDEVLVVRSDGQISIPTNLEPVSEGSLVWSIETEQGQEFGGEERTEDLVAVGRRKNSRRYELILPCDLPLGYHRLAVSSGDTDYCETELIVTPGQAFGPAVGKRKVGSVGVMAPLYGLSSKRNLGIGDFADLGALAETLAPLGCGFIGINPVHALFPSQPARISPYSPSSRTAQNVLLIAVDQIPEFALSPNVQAILAGSDIGATLKELRASEFVDYRNVARVKFTLLEELFKTFGRLPPTSTRRQSFEAFVEMGGERLLRHARFEALCEYFTSGNAGRTDWHDWPNAYHDPGGVTVQQFAEAHRDRVTFFAYLQWIAHDQLEAAQRRATAAGMPIGLHLDIAVGVAPDGAEAWTDRDLLVDTVRIGAPPDDFNPNGQDWGLLPMAPAAMRKDRYRGFIDRLRCTMRYAGAVRIDHIIGFARSFWLLPGDERAGAYVRYPMDDLLGLVALESHRQRCMVIGEDLGTVPENLRAALLDRGLLGCRVLQFERDEKRAFRAPSSYPETSIASLGTHDLPTLAGFWEGRDIGWRERLGIIPSARQSSDEFAERRQDRARLLHLLSAENLMPDGLDPENPPETLSRALVDAIHLLLARTPARLKAIRLEDALGVVEQANLPGTINEHPNWCRKLPRTVDDIAAGGELGSLLRLFDDSHVKADECVCR